MTGFVASPMGTAGLLWHYYDYGIRNSATMRPTQYPTATLIDLFHRQTVASLPEVMPLRSYQTILNHIRTTTTDTGLCVTAQLVDQEYPKGVKISDAQFASIALQPHQVQPLRNYTICPRP